MHKITLVLHDLRGGGAEKMMVRLANQMAEDGDQIEMILITEGGSNKAFLSDKVTLTELKCIRTLNAFGPLRRALKKSKPDAILAVLTHINVITAIVCFSLGWIKRLSVSERNTFSLDKKVNTNAVMRTAYFLAPLVYRLLPKPVIAVSQGVAQDLVDTTMVRQKDVITAPNPVITKEIEEASKAPPSHPWLKDKTKPVIISVGRLAYQKGFDMLLDALFRVRETIDCRLIIYGEGELREQLQKQAESLGITEDVDFPGYTDNPVAEMKAADLYVLSSRFEGSPNAIVEAMSVGTPVVAFDCPHGAREILKDGEIAPLVEYQNVEELACKMASTLAKTYDTAKATEIVKDKFTSENSAQAYRDLLVSKK
ncbi:glycosyltransferase [Glaciecola sp. 1036]|uniref:glycosyltransferase n=1 Tax=Alteromonadaceae TaxID=72275 RepID=UPI003CFD1EF5